MSQSGSIDLGTTSGAFTPSGAAGGELAGNYPNPTVVATDAATASTLVRRDANGNDQFAALTMTHVSAGVDNVGLGGPASASTNFPLLIQRSVATPLVTQTANPSTAAGSGAKDQLSVDNGNNNAEMGLFTSATAAPDAYAGGNMTLRSSGSTAGIALIADDSATYIKHYVGGNGAGNLALQTKTDLSTISYGGVIISTAGARPTAGVAYRGMLFVVQGAGGATDTLEVCLKSAADTYSWVSIITGG